MAYEPRGDRGDHGDRGGAQGQDGFVKVRGRRECPYCFLEFRQ